MTATTTHEKGPAATAIAPDPVQSNPAKEMNMNMQTHTTEPAAEARRPDPHMVNQLGDVIDRLCDANNLCEAVFMASGYLQTSEASAIQAVILEAQNRIKAGSDALYAIRGDAR